MIIVEKLIKQYPGIKALNDVSFSINSGEVVGLLGPNGAGKSTIMKILATVINPTMGTVHVNGCDVLQGNQKVKRMLAYVPEKTPVYENLTIHEYLLHMAHLRNVAQKQQLKRIEYCVDLLELHDHYHRLIRNLSKGFKQRVAIAQALLGEPQILLLDEPTAGLDPRQTNHMRSIIRDLAKNHTIIFSTHLLHEVMAVCERVVILHKGKIVADANLDQLVEQYSTQNQQRSLEEIFLTLTSS